MKSRTLANYPALIRDFTRIGEQRLNPFSQVDLRVDKKWSFNNWSLDLFFEIQNALHKQLRRTTIWFKRNTDGTIIEPQELIQVNLKSEATILPSVGIVVNF